MVQKVDITPKDVIWSAKNDFVAILGKESFFLLQYESEVTLCLSFADMFRKLRRLSQN